MLIRKVIQNEVGRACIGQGACAYREGFIEEVTFQ